jgi:thymidylate synthase
MGTINEQHDTRQMNSLDKQYTDLLQDILDNGVTKQDRTGTGTISVFGRQIRHSMKDGFPLLTTKKMPFKTIVTELLWFLRGETNIKFLVDNNCHIWDGDCYVNYLKKYEQDRTPGIVYYTDPLQYRPYSQEEFINKIKINDEFAKKWGELGPIYGKQWRDWTLRPSVNKNTGEIFLGYQYVDQIQNLIDDLKTNPDSRRLMVNAWNVGELDSMVLPPCHYGFQLYTVEMTNIKRCEYWAKRCGKDISYTKNLTDEKLDELFCPKRKLSLMWNQRSVDVPLGLPFNIASYGVLLMLIGEIVNMVPDQLIGSLGDTHIYLNQIDGVREQITREPFKLPQLHIDTQFWYTESGECGVGLLSPNINHTIEDAKLEDFQLTNYISHPTIKFALSN